MRHGIAACVGPRFIVVVTLLAGCPAPVEPIVLPPGCSPLLADVHCGLPYPSDHFLVADPTLPSGRRVEITGEAQLLTSAGLSANPTTFLPQDGFSRLPPIVWSFGVAVDPTSLPGLADDPAATTAPGFPIALMRASDGSRVPFFVDIDPRATSSAREALILRPLVKLEPETRYIVAVSGVVGVDGPIPVPEGFRRLRDGLAAVGDDPVMSALLDRYDAEIFPVVVDAGLERADLQLAWDFTTGSDIHVVADLSRARTLVLEELARVPPVVTVEGFFEGEQLARIFDDAPELSWRAIELRVTGPRVVDGDEAGAILARDDNGLVRLDGTTTFEVTVIIPASVRDGFVSGRPLLFGHGFFGTRSEAEGSAIRRIANEAGRVLFAIDWKGMSTEDIGIVSTSLGENVAEALRFGERLPQAMMNWVTLSELIAAGGLDDLTVEGNAALRPFRRPASGPGTAEQGGVSNAGTAIVDGADMVHLGISQGHILGSVMTTVNARVRRSVLQVGGGGFSHMMFRARPFAGFLLFLDSSLPDPLDQQLLTAQLQRGFDRFDPLAWSPFTLDSSLPEGPDSGAGGRQVLLQIGRADSQVPNLGAFLHARALGVPWIAPSAIAAPFGLTTSTAPVRGGSGIYAFDYGLDPSFENTADFPDATFVHDSVRRTPEAIAQMKAFFDDGTIVDPCEGGCGVIDRP
jgi:hypothetical protein